ncbi:MAG: alpha/beta hydrolase [Prolixibacteraceae bacterium]
MKRAFIGLAMLLMFQLAAISQSHNYQGKIIESLSFESKILKRSVNYSVYLPFDYDYSNKKYPVLYLLHGRTGNETDWPRSGRIQFLFENALINGEVPEMVIIMPAAENTYYINDYKGEVRYEDMFFQELIPTLEQKYRIIGNKDNRVISGLSMGGYGALVYATHHPEMFKTCVALSAAVRTEKTIQEIESDNWNKWFSPMYPGTTGQSRVSNHWRKNSPINIIHTAAIDQIKTVKFMIDCGDDDELDEANFALHREMRNLGIEHEFTIRDGHHDWMYWRKGMAEGLKFIGFYIMGGW